MSTETSTSAFIYQDMKPRLQRRAPRQHSAKRVDFVSIRLVKESSTLYERRQIKSADDAADLVRPLLEDSDREQFVVAALDTKHRPTQIHVVSVGALDCTIVHPREVFKFALLGNASGIICYHNHPSGDPSPSQEDISLTRRLMDSAKVLGIDLLDHLIIGDNERYVSLKAKGLM